MVDVELPKVETIRVAIRNVGKLRGLSDEIRSYAVKQKTVGASKEVEMQSSIFEMKRYIKFYKDNGIITSDEEDEVVSKVDDIKSTIRHSFMESNEESIKDAVAVFNHYFDMNFSSMVAEWASLPNLRSALNKRR